MEGSAPRRLGPVWVWLLGIVVLIIAILLLLDWVAGRRNASDAGAAAAAAAPLPGSETDVALPLSALLPLQPADTGVLAAFDGEVVGQPLKEGVWILMDGGRIIFVQIEGDDGLRRKAGDRLSGRGVVRYDPRLVDDWIRWGELKVRERASSIEDFYIATVPREVKEESP